MILTVLCCTHEFSNVLINMSMPREH